MRHKLNHEVVDAARIITNVFSNDFIPYTKQEIAYFNKNKVAAYAGWQMVAGCSRSIEAFDTFAHRSVEVTEYYAYTEPEASDDITLYGWHGLAVAWFNQGQVSIEAQINMDEQTVHIQRPLIDDKAWLCLDDSNEQYWRPVVLSALCAATDELSGF